MRARLALAGCMFASLLTVLIFDGSSIARAEATQLGNCTTAGAPSQFPFRPHHPVVFSTDFRGASLPSGWWLPPSPLSFNQYTVHDATNVALPGNELQLTNDPDKDGVQQDMGIAGENAILATSGRMPNGSQGDDMLLAWCARFTSNSDVDTAFVLGQSNSKPWPPEIDLVEGAGRIAVFMHWTCDSSIRGCPSTDGDFNGTVARSGSYAPWPPPGTSVGHHYFCDTITNASGQQVYNNPNDGHFDYNCRAQFNLSLPRGVSVTSWNQFGAQLDPRGDRLWVWVDSEPPVMITDRTCGSHILFDDNGRLSTGEIENGRSSEPCLQVGGNWQWSVQQNEWKSRKTLPGLTAHDADTADVSWFGAYSYTR